jgi:hypothetical protein
LNHVSGLPVVRRGREASRDNDSVGVFMKDESVQRAPPLKREMMDSRFCSL